MSNGPAIVGLILAKLAMIGGVMCSSGSLRPVGGCLLTLSGALLTTVLMFTARSMRALEKQEKDDFEALRRMLADGTLTSKAHAIGYHADVFERKER